jgi:hypothetical protein
MRYGAMTKKKAKSKTEKITKAKKSGGGRGKKKELNPAEVRKDISRMVESHAASMAQAVIGRGEMGQLATVKFLFEMASIFPAATEESQATEDEDCLARTLLNRLDLPTEPVGRDDEDEPGRVARPAAAADAEKSAGLNESNRQHGEPKSLEPKGGTGDGDSTKVSPARINNTVE